MVKSYQEIVRQSSRRDPQRHSAVPPHLGASASTASTSSPLTHSHQHSPAPPQPDSDPTYPNGRESATYDSSTMTSNKDKDRKSRFHSLAKLQMAGLGRRKDKHAKAARAELDRDADDDGTASDASRRVLAPHPHPHPGYPAYPGYPPYGYPPYVNVYGPSLHPPPHPPHSAPLPLPHYPYPGTAPPSTAASTSVLPSPTTATPVTGPGTAATTHTGAASSPTSPTTPASTGVAHYYPYVASQPRRQNSNSGYSAAGGTLAGGGNGTMASPLSFKSRGSGRGEDGAGADGDVSGSAKSDKGKGRMLDSLPLPGSGGAGSAARREPSLPPGAGVPNGTSGLAPPAPRPTRAHSNPPPPSFAPYPYAAGSLPPSAPPSQRASPHPHPQPAHATSSASLRSRAPAQSAPPAPPPPPGASYPYPPYPGYAPYPGYPPPHPYGYPPYPPYGPPQPPPAGQRRPGPPSHAGSSVSLPQSTRSRAPAPPSIYPPPPPHAYPYPHAPPYGPHPLSAPAAPGSSPAVAAVARNMQQQQQQQGRRAESVSGTVNGGAEAKGEGKGRKEDEGKLSVGIDFGTTFTGIAYGSSRMFGGQIRQILSWPGSYETYRKVPTCILYEQHDPAQEAKVVAWGIEAKNATVRSGLIKCEWFKLLLSPESLRSGVPDPWLPPLPAGKNVVDVIADFLRCVWRYARRVITEEIGSVVDLNAADVLLTVPAAWDAAACSLMRESALRAGLVQSSRGGDTRWRDRLQIITEPEAGAIHASTLATLHHLRPSQSFLLCDAGGGTVDSAVYKLMGQLSELEIAEMCVRSGANTGSLFVDLKFEELLRRILKDHPVHLEPASMATFIHAFAEGDKLAYHGTTEDDVAIFRFNCFNVEDSHDPAVGLEFGELAIPGKVLKTEVFDPIIEQVLDHLSAQIAKIGHTPLDAIILVGGFAASEYLYTRVRQAFGAQVPVIVRPQDCDTATLRGAARYGLGLKMGKGAVSSVIAPRSYCMKSKLPAEDEDHWRRPEFIATNDGGTVVCENRLSYLIAKGAVLRKGERLRSRFCKYIKDPHDSVFTAHLFVSDSEELYRYTDEGDLHELCRWTVDLATLPRFQEIVARGGGYIEFEAGLSLDSAEVRGVLMTEDGVECAAATFEFLGT
ncbi:hypothetical protein JCM10207_003291 [Rhodosporidiobolus poonsookiae]